MKELYGEILRTVGSNHDQRNEIESTNEITIKIKNEIFDLVPIYGLISGIRRQYQIR